MLIWDVLRGHNMEEETTLMENIRSFENIYKETWQITFRFHPLSAVQIKNQLERGKNLEPYHQSFHTCSKYLHTFWLMACCD